MAQSSNVGSILKWGAIAAGLYLAWQYGLFDGLGLPFLPLSPAGTAAAAAAAANPVTAPPASTATPPAATGGGAPTASTAGGTLATTPTVTGGGGNAQTPGQGLLTPDQVDAMIKSASAGDIVAAAQATGLGIQMRFDQWNYYRSVATGTNAPATPGLDQVGTANQYLAYRQAQGLSGIASLGRIPLGAVRVYGTGRRTSYPVN